MNKMWLTTAEYAKHRNVSGKAIRKHIASGRIPAEAVKKPGRTYMIHQTKADEALAGNLQSKSKSEKRKAINAAGIQNCKSLTDAQKLDREYQAALRKLVYQEKCGDLVSKAQVEKEAFDSARRVRDAMLSIPDRISAQVAAISNQDEINTMLSKEIRQALTGITAQ